MDLLITGATGFLGSHLALCWLRRHPTARVGCVVRASDATSGLSRLRAALCRAAADEGTTVDDLLARVDAFAGELDDPAWVRRAEGWLRGPTEFVHCAANLSFREADRQAVWQTNVGGTTAVLAAAAKLHGIVAFNYVGTAYVAGDRQGDIMEGERDQPANFNNPYEHSKWTAEGLVRKTCAAAAIPWRIMRPSIVIGHSKTHRLASQSGFYQVIDTLLQMGRLPKIAAGPVRLPVTIGTTVNLIPVDVVMDEIMGLIAAGGATADQTFHVVAADPLRLAEVLLELTPMSGVAIEVNGPNTPLSPVARLVMNRLRYYMPYFAFARRFDRTGIQAALGTTPYRIDVEQLRGFVRSYLEQGQPRALKAAA